MVKHIIRSHDWLSSRYSQEMTTLVAILLSADLLWLKAQFNNVSQITVKRNIFGSRRFQDLERYLARSLPGASLRCALCGGAFRKLH